MVFKYENLTDSEIIENYKRLKELQREKNRMYYERLKTNKVKYRARLTDALEQQQQRIQLIKSDEDTYNYYKECKQISNMNYYINKKIKQNDNDTC